MTANAEFTVCWSGRRARLVGETLVSRPATSEIGQQLLGDVAGFGPDDLMTLRLDWPGTCTVPPATHWKDASAACTAR